MDACVAAWEAQYTTPLLTVFLRWQGKVEQQHVQTGGTSGKGEVALMQTAEYA